MAATQISSLAHHAGCLAGADDPRADLDDILELARLAKSLGWTSSCTAAVLDLRYGLQADDGTDLMCLTKEQAADLKDYLIRLAHEWNS